MPAAGYQLQEVDLSTRVASFPGVYGSIVIPAKWGPLEPYLVSSDTGLLKKFTWDQKVNVGESGAFYSALAFLEKSDKLWVSRAVNGALYSAASVKASTSPFNSLPIPVGLADPSAYVFDSGDDAAAVAQVFTVATLADVAGSLHLKGFVAYDDVGSVAIVLDVGNTGDPYPAWATALNRQIRVAIVANDTADAVAAAIQSVVDADSKFSVAAVGSIATITGVPAGARTAPVDQDSGFAINVTVVGQDAQNIQDEVMLLHAIYPGSAGKKIYYTIHTYANSPNIVKEEGAFLLRIFREDNLANAVEEWTLSRNESHRDGYGTNIYLEVALEGSEYVRAIDNIALANTIYPKEQLTPVALGDGSDGSAVADSHMIEAAGKFANPDDVFITLLMDGGWATPAYQQYVDSLVAARYDSVALDSVPYVKEASSNYLNDIVDYRKTELNLNSSYSALYTPHVKIYDRYNDRNLFVSPEGYAAAAISYSAANYEVWYPAAGAKRGKVNVLDLKRRFTKSEMDVLQDNGINPLRFTPGKGILIWGQKTLLSRESALDRLNVRLMLIVVEPAVGAALEDFIFDLNDVETRTLAKSKIDSYMDKIKAKKGVYDFLVVCDDTNNTADDIDNNIMNLDLYVKPSKSIEFIKVRVVITSTGVDFSSLT